MYLGIKELFRTLVNCTVGIFNFIGKNDTKLYVDIECDFNPLYTKNENPTMATLTNSEEQDEMAHNETFYQNLHSLLSKVKSILMNRNT